VPAAQARRRTIAAMSANSRPKARYGCDVVARTDEHSTTSTPQASAFSIGRSADAHRSPSEAFHTTQRLQRKATTMAVSQQAAIGQNSSDRQCMNSHQKIQAVTTAVQQAAEFRSRGRPTKFTPERLRQITNLVERGKTREEIAEIIGVTTGTLQVTCSKLGISLRRPRFDTETGLLRLRQSRSHTAAPPIQTSSHRESMMTEHRRMKAIYASVTFDPFILRPSSKGVNHAKLEFSGKHRSDREQLIPEAAA
jgi:hypothetical protein